MTLSTSQKIAVFIVFFAIGISWKGWWELSFLLFFIALAFTVPQNLWVWVGGKAYGGWTYVAPRAHAMGGQAAHHAGQAAHQASNRFRADPWFWSSVITAILALVSLLCAAGYQNLGALLVAIVFATLSAVCFITYRNWWGPIRNELAEAVAFAKKETGELISKYPLIVWLAVSLLLFGLALYNEWANEIKIFAGMSALAAFITIFEWWGSVGEGIGWFFKTAVGQNPKDGLEKMMILDGALLCIYGYYVSQEVHRNLGIMITTGAIGVVVVVLGLKKFFEYGNKK